MQRLAEDAPKHDVDNVTVEQPARKDIDLAKTLGPLVASPVSAPCPVEAAKRQVSNASACVAMPAAPTPAAPMPAAPPSTLPPRAAVVSASTGSWGPRSDPWSRAKSNDSATPSLTAGRAESAPPWFEGPSLPQRQQQQQQPPPQVDSQQTSASVDPRDWFQTAMPEVRQDIMQFMPPPPRQMPEHLRTALPSKCQESFPAAVPSTAMPCSAPQPLMFQVNQPPIPEAHARAQYTPNNPYVGDGYQASYGSDQAPYDHWGGWQSQPKLLRTIQLSNTRRYTLQHPSPCHQQGSA